MKRVKGGAGLSKALKEVGERAEKDFTKYLKKITLDGFGWLVYYSAEDSAFLKSNWRVAVNIPPDSTEIPHPGGEGYSPAKFPSIRLKAGDFITMYNATEYAFHLEHGTIYTYAQPMIFPTYYKLEILAKRLAYTLSKKKYNN